MLQGGEIIIIALLALIVLGPKRLPEMARKVGKWTTELRAAAREISAGLENEVADLRAAGEDLRAVGDELRGQADQIKQPLADIEKDVKAADPRGYEWTGPKPLSGPTPADAMADLERIDQSDAGAEEE